MTSEGNSCGWEQAPTPRQIAKIVVADTRFIAPLLTPFAGPTAMRKSCRLRPLHESNLELYEECIVCKRIRCRIIGWSVRSCTKSGMPTEFIVELDLRLYLGREIFEIVGQARNRSGVEVVTHGRVGIELLIHHCRLEVLE